jgi:hypothetical protein
MAESGLLVKNRTDITQALPDNSQTAEKIKEINNESHEANVNLSKAWTGLASKGFEYLSKKQENLYRAKMRNNIDKLGEEAYNMNPTNLKEFQKNYDKMATTFLQSVAPDFQNEAVAAIIGNVRQYESKIDNNFKNNLDDKQKYEYEVEINGKLPILQDTYKNIMSGQATQHDIDYYNNEVAYLKEQLEQTTHDGRPMYNASQRASIVDEIENKTKINGINSYFIDEYQNDTSDGMVVSQRKMQYFKNNKEAVMQQYGLSEGQYLQIQSYNDKLLSNIKREQVSKRKSTEATLQKRQQDVEKVNNEIRVEMLLDQFGITEPHKKKGVPSDISKVKVSNKEYDDILEIQNARYALDQMYNTDTLDKTTYKKAKQKFDTVYYNKLNTKQKGDRAVDFALNRVRESFTKDFQIRTGSSLEDAQNSSSYKEVDMRGLKMDVADRVIKRAVVEGLDLTSKDFTVKDRINIIAEEEKQKEISNKFTGVKVDNDNVILLDGQLIILNNRASPRNDMTNIDKKKKRKLIQVN